MPNNTDILSAEKIYSELGTLKSEFNIEVAKTVTSTNVILKKSAVNGALEGTVLIASEQTEGRGRFKRSFFSPQNSGIYMSILLRPNIPAENAVLITTAAAVAVTQAIEKLTGSKIEIKWVNDLILNNKKICGILTESSLNTQNGKLNYAVLGIGINVYPPSNNFPDEIQDIAGAIIDEQKADFQNILSAEILINFWKFYKSLIKREYLFEYRKHCMVIGKNIDVIKDGNTYPAKALEIDDDCRLLVQYPNGIKETLYSGEISIIL